MKDFQQIWSQKEVKLLLDLSDKRQSVKSCLCFFPKRSYASIANKRARLRKNMQLWGKTHAKNKRKLLEYWLSKYKPKYVIEAFAGTGNSTELYAQTAKKVTACEYSRKFYSMAEKKLIKYDNIELHNKSADTLLHSICASSDCNYDWIDLDPFGTVSSLIPLAIDALNSGYICCTITDLHSLRFGQSNPFSWRYMLPKDVSNMKVSKQLGYLLGWIIFDCSRRIFPRGNDMHKMPKIIKPIQIFFLGPQYVRLVRVLFKVDQVKSSREIKNYIFKELSLFKNGSNLPYLNINEYLTNIT